MDNHRNFNYNHYQQSFKSMIPKGSNNQLLNAFKADLNSHYYYYYHNNDNNRQNNRRMEKNFGKHHQKSIINIIIQLIILIIIIECHSPNVQSAAIVLSSPRKNYPLTSKFFFQIVTIKHYLIRFVSLFDSF